MTINNLPPSVVNDTTTEFFNNYYTDTRIVSSSINDAFIAFFETLTGSRETAAVLAGSIILTAQQQDLDLLQILKRFQQLDRNKIDSYLTLLLNLNRVNTSLLGVVTEPGTNKYVSRSIHV